MIPIPAVRLTNNGRVPPLPSSVSDERENHEYPETQTDLVPQGSSFFGTTCVSGASRVWDFPARRSTGTGCGGSGTSVRSVVSRKGSWPRSTASPRARRLVMRRGSIVDATLVRSAASSKNRRKDGTAVDPDADWTRREKGDAMLGDKLHAAVGKDTGIVRQIAITPAFAGRAHRGGSGGASGRETAVSRCGL